MNKKQKKLRLKRLKLYQSGVSISKTFFNRYPIDAAEEFARCLGISKEELMNDFNANMALVDKNAVA